MWTRSLTAWVPFGGHSENEALYDGRAQRARLHRNGAPICPSHFGGQIVSRTLTRPKLKEKPILPGLFKLRTSAWRSGLVSYPVLPARPQKSRAFGVQRPSPLATMLAITAQT